ncbi:amidohydrolase family protein [Candidatus Poriferisocius sp.]|uniref:amidohydrolase family protein n=1 Tax=Candidatus Poriferisocius sp. TaxID=3101276 RepID=UPI003B01B883
MDFNRFDWLAQRVEEAIDPHREIVDPHHHFYDGGFLTYLAADHLDNITGSHNITKTVFVETAACYDMALPEHMQPVGETAFAVSQADAIDAADGPPLAGIVAFADLTLGDALEEVLDAHDATSSGRLRGIRHTTGIDPSPEVPQGHGNPSHQMMGTNQFRAGLRTLVERDLSFDAWLYHPQLLEVAELAAAMPELRVVVGHLGAPLGVGPYRDIRDQVWADWRSSMQAVAAQPNAVVKVGGIGMDFMFGMGWADLLVPPGSEEVAAYWSDAVRFCIDAFGPDRCMFESNYPVDRETLTYPVLWNAFQIMADAYSNAEQDDLFSGTATRVYRLD